MVRDLQLVDNDLEIARGKYIELLQFLSDKPFLKDKLTTTFNLLGEKIQILEGIIEQNRLQMEEYDRVLNNLSDALEIKEVSKSEIISKGLLAVYNLKK